MKYIRETIPNIEKVEAFHVYTGPTPAYSNLLLEIHLFVGSVLHEISFYTNKRNHFIFNPKSIGFVLEEYSDSCVVFKFESNVGELFVVEVKGDEEKKFREFISIFLEKAWR